MMETKKTVTQQEVITPEAPPFMDEATFERIDRHSHPEVMTFEELCDVDNL